MDEFLQINQLFWRGSPFQWLFYFSVILIIFFEKRKIYKLVFGIYPIVMLVGMFNPLTSFLVTSILRRSNAYYVRLFSIVPVFYCMAHGAMLILNKTKDNVKLLGVFTIVVFIIIMGRCVYRESWMKRAENLKKTPNEVFDVLDTIPNEKENNCIALPDPLYLYARQVDGNILMPYGRQMSGPSIPLLDEIQKSAPDVSTVMSLAGSSDVDYIVVKNSEETRSVFSNNGFEPIGETRRHCIYPVTGVSRTKRILNDHRQVISSTACDPDGNPTQDGSIIVTRIEYGYDKWGNCTEERFYDKNDQRVTTIEGYSGRRKSYVMHGLAWVINSIKYLDTEDQPLMAGGRYETRYRYVKRRDIIEESYYDADGRSMNRLDTGYAATTILYDEKGRCKSERFYDTAGEAVMCFGGYAGYTREYDDMNRITAERYFDTRGDEVDNAAGFAQWLISYDNDGNVVEETFLNQEGKEIDIRERVMRDTSSDLLQRAKKESSANSVGVGYNWNEDGSCTIIGEAKGISWNNLVMGDRPFYFINGETYRVEYSGEKVLLCVYFYEDPEWRNRIDDLFTYGDAEFTVPQNCRAMIIRLWVAPGTNVNETVHPRIYVK